MAKWVRSGVLDNGLNDIKNNATEMVLLKAYSAGDSFATVATNTIATVAMTSTDYTLSGASGAPRILTVASGKTATASANSGATPDLHVAFTDGTANVIWVTDATDQVITSGNTINFPSNITYTANQPT